MAKVTGPAHSVRASGTLAGLITFDKRNIAHKPNAPGNQRTAERGNARQIFLSMSRALQLCQAPVKTAIKAAANPTRDWRAWLMQRAIGEQRAAWNSTGLVWANFTDPQRATWDDAATATGFTATAIAYATDDPISAGLAMFELAEALYAPGIITSPGEPAADNAAAWAEAITGTEPPPPPPPDIELLQSKKNISSFGADAQQTSFDSQPTVGSLIIVAVGTYNGNLETTAITDNHGNTYTRAAHLYYTQSGPFCVAIFYAVVATTGTPFTITVNPAGANTYISTCVAEFTGITSSSPLDKNNTASSGSASPTVSVTTTTDGELYIACVTWDSSNTTLTEGENWILLQENEGGGPNMGLGVQYRITAAGTIAATWTLGGSRRWFAALASFKPA